MVSGRSRCGVPSALANPSSHTTARVPKSPARVEAGPRAVRADLVQHGVDPALDAPALVIGEVQVQAVQLEGGERVDQGQHLALGEEVPGQIEVSTAPGQGGGGVESQGAREEAG